MRTLCRAIFLLILSLGSAKCAESYPLWNGRESVEDYAQRVQLPLVRTFDLGNGVKLELALIPAGKFMMGTPMPAPPSVTVAGSWILIAVGGSLIFALLMTHFNFRPRGRKWSFSLSGLFCMMLACAITVAGAARMHLAEQALKTYAAELDDYRSDSGNNEPYLQKLIARPFYMGKFDVTQAQYQAITGSNPSYFKGRDLPVESVTASEGVAFCEKLLEKISPRLGAGAAIELPTETQWEYACRAGTTTRFHTGDSISTDDANIKGTWDPKYLRGIGIDRGLTTPVGSFKPNAFGLCDMHGNVCQWCRTDRDIEKFTCLGCSFAGNSIGCRSACRLYTQTGDAQQTIGFRVILTLEN